MVDESRNTGIGILLAFLIGAAAIFLVVKYVPAVRTMLGIETISGGGGAGGAGGGGGGNRSDDEDRPPIIIANGSIDIKTGFGSKGQSRGHWDGKDTEYHLIHDEKTTKDTTGFMIAVHDSSCDDMEPVPVTSQQVKYLKGVTEHSFTISIDSSGNPMITLDDAPAQDANNKHKLKLNGLYSLKSVQIGSKTCSFIGHVAPLIVLFQIQ